MIIVTGGAGFIGSAVVWRLNQAGHDKILVVDHLAKSEKWKNLARLRFDDYVHKDEFLRRLERGTIPRAEAVIQLGACSSTTERDADYLMANNYAYSRTLASWCLERGVRFIYASSAATYGDGASDYVDDESMVDRLRPLNGYGYSKQRFDQWALASGAIRQMVGLKFFNVFGPNEYHKGDMASVVFKAFGQIRNTGRVQLFKSHHPDYADGQQARDFVYVKDCAEVILWLLERRTAGLFNLGTGIARTWNDLTRAVFAAMKLPPQIDYVDMPEALRGRYQYFTQATMAKLHAAGCPVTFRSLEDAVRDYVVNYLQADDPYLAPQTVPAASIRSAA
ncbi:MAG TPA: ADP-glyceromanno-heptose 6-epimerase [Pirellulales bacterium]|jgi:ADP-L-glycero-D-manno-heptose 6-epimerase|nr:ADP-glyceromanno-heptose 6-epimerase [Pirellulales bacterium]